MSEWQTVKLGEIASITKLAGFEFTKYIKYDSSGEIIALRALNLRNGILDLSDIKRIDKKSSNNLTRSKIYKNDVLLTYTGNGYGDSAFITENDKYHLAPNIAKITAMDNVCPIFVFQYIKSKLFKEQMRSFIVGSSQPTLPMKTLRVLSIPLPPLSEQQAIAATLSCLDDKIELNNRMNKTLEEMAQAIFKRWFVDFEFPTEDGQPYKSSGGAMVDSELGEIPQGWRIGTLGENIEIFDSKRIPLSSRQRTGLEKIYPYYGATSIMDYVDNYIFDGIYILMGEDGSVIDENEHPFLQYVWGKFWVNNHAHILKGKERFSDEYIFTFLKGLNVRDIVTGAVQLKINQSNLCNVKITVPEIDIANQINEILKDIYSQFRNNSEQNHTLAAIRDALLPKLMSGEIRVPIGGGVSG